MQRFDIRLYKKNLRDKYKAIRLAMTAEQKAQSGAEILARLQRLWQVKNASLVLTYVSTDIEVDTLALIEQLLAQGKQVAVPYCVANTRDMCFYRIRSFDDLERRTFGVMEPVPERCERVTDFLGSVCIVPGLTFDRQGFRLGYGKGYYDRFLSSYRGVMVGICYASCITRRLHRGRYDVACDILVTENETINCRTAKD